MRALPLFAAAVLSTTAAPAIAQDFLGRLVQGTAQSAAQNLANRAVAGATRGRPTKAAAPQPARAAAAAAAPATEPAQVQAQASTPAPVAAAAPAATAPAVAPSPSGGGVIIRNHMPVITSDGVRVAETMHAREPEEVYGPEKTFFTADPTYRLRRIYGREAVVRGGAVHLKMTAAQYRARNQNPEFHPG